MSTELEVVRPQQDSWVAVVGDVWRLAEAVSRTEFVPTRMRQKPEAVAACILTGRELGLGPMTSLRGIDVIEGSPSLSTELLAARMLAAGHRIEWKKISDETCTVHVTRGDRLSEAEVTWTMNDARRAGLASKSNWQKYPRAMLRSRALSECAQLVCPDVSLGLDVAQTNVPAAEEQPTAPLATIELVRTQPEQREEAQESVAVEEAELVDESDAETAEGASDDVHELATSDDVHDQSEYRERDEPTIDQSEMISAGQIRALNAILRDVEKVLDKRLTRDERRARIMFAAGLQPNERESTTELTWLEASTAIDALQDMLRTMRDEQTNPGQQELA